MREEQDSHDLHLDQTETSQRMFRADVFDSEILEIGEGGEGFVVKFFKEALLAVLEQSGAELRGFTCLRQVYPPDEELIALIAPQVMQQHAAIAELSERTRKAWERALRIPDERVITQALNLVDKFEILAMRVFSKLLMPPDVDLILPKGFEIQSVFTAWESVKIDGKSLPLEYLIPTDNYKGMQFGWRVNVEDTSNPLLKKIRLELGYYSPKSQRFESSYYIEATPLIDNDFRAEYGLSTDKIRGKHVGGGVYEIDPETVATDVRFPEKFPPAEVIDPLHYYLLQAPRAIRQAVWHGLPLVIPDNIPEINDKLALRIFQKNSRVREDLAKNLADSFMFDPKLAFRYARELGLWRVSEHIPNITDEQLIEVENRLPDREEHKRRLKANGQVQSVEEIYSPFKTFVDVLCEVGWQHFDAFTFILKHKDWLMFDIFF